MKLQQQQQQQQQPVVAVTLLCRECCDRSTRIFVVFFQEECMVVVTERMRMDSAMRCRCLLLAFVVTAAAARRLDPVASSHGRELGENGDGDLGGLSRERFPKGFVFGTGSSAYQVYSRIRISFDML